jgi:hypothetical protein
MDTVEAGNGSEPAQDPQTPPRKVKLSDVVLGGEVRVLVYPTNAAPDELPVSEAFFAAPSTNTKRNYEDTAFGLKGGRKANRAVAVNEVINKKFLRFGDNFEIDEDLLRRHGNDPKRVLTESELGKRLAAEIVNSYIIAITPKTEQAGPESQSED